ncbi:MAG: RDD family protein [Mariprofundaceae bacterium]|nr:RDD family protein [Mariprofundaceae bacterium]
MSKKQQLDEISKPVREQAVLAGFMVRSVASLYDIGLVFALAFLLFIPVTAAEQSMGVIPEWIKGMLTLTVFWAYFVGFWSRSGETTGMRPWRLRLVMAGSGEIPSLAAASIRFAVLMATWLAAGFVLLSMLTGKTQNTTYATVALLPLVNLVCLALTEKRQALHDLLAGVIVVRIDK